MFLYCAGMSTVRNYTCWLYTCSCAVGPNNFNGVLCSWVVRFPRDVVSLLNSDVRECTRHHELLSSSIMSIIKLFQTGRSRHSYLFTNRCTVHLCQLATPFARGSLQTLANGLVNQLRKNTKKFSLMSSICIHILFYFTMFCNV